MLAVELSKKKISQIQAVILPAEELHNIAINGFDRFYESTRNKENAIFRLKQLVAQAATKASHNGYFNITISISSDWRKPFYINHQEHISVEAIDTDIHEEEFFRDFISVGYKLYSLSTKTRDGYSLFVLGW